MNERQEFEVGDIVKITNNNFSSYLIIKKYHSRSYDVIYISFKNPTSLYYNQSMHGYTKLC